MVCIVIVTKRLSELLIVIRYYFVTGGLKYLDEDRQLLVKYRQFLEQPSEHERQIDLDIPRTMHGHVLFRTRYGYG